MQSSDGISQARQNTAVFAKGQRGAFAGPTAQSMLQIAALAVTM
jgi:hypothetical protein